MSAIFNKTIDMVEVMWWIINTMELIATVLVALLVILAVALSTLAERKVMGAMQRRIGPKKVGIIGMLQPIADGLKLVLKESVVPLSSTFLLFRLTPYIGFVLALVNWLVLPLDSGLALSELPAAGLLILIAISELSIYSIILSGWSANSKYPLLGSLRSTAQMISYSITLSLIILSVASVLGTINLLHFMMIDHHIILPLLPLAILFAISAVAETNRAPEAPMTADSEPVKSTFSRIRVPPVMGMLS